MKYTAGQAAKAVGKSIPTITRAIKRGVISAERTTSGGYLIDPAELHRVFPAVTPERNASPDVSRPETLQEVAVTPRQELETRMLREMLAREQETVADLRARLDAEAAERRRLTALLTHQEGKPELLSPPQPRWRLWWSGREK